MDKKRNLLIKIVVPVLIVVAVAAIWLFKNPDVVQPIPEATSTPVPTSTELVAAPPTSVATNAPSTTEQPSAAAANFTLEVTEMVDFAALAEHQLPAIVDYGSDSCIPCKEMAPVLFNADGTPFTPSETLAGQIQFTLYSRKQTNMSLPFIRAD